MAFCKFSTNEIYKKKTEIDNRFINDYLPYAPDSAIKVYLYGMYMCSCGNVYDNDLKKFSTILNLKESEVIDCFKYWEDQGLVLVSDSEPFQVIYLPIDDVKYNIKKYNQEKYHDFNLKLQEIFDNSKMLMPLDYSKFYDMIEVYHIEPEALLMITKYCVNLKGSKTYINYISAVAKAWASENITTVSAVEEKLKEYDAVSDELKLLLKAMSISRLATLEERQLFLKWTKIYGFSPEIIVFVAKKHKKLAKSLNFEKLNEILEKYKELSLFTEKEIEEYIKSQDEMLALAKKIVKNLGLYYQDYSMVIETYIYTWKNMGFENETLEKFSEYCFSSSINSLEMMDKNLKKLYKLGIVTLESLEDYLSFLSLENEKISEILSELSLNRKIIGSDRNFYHTWISDWQFSDEMIKYAVELAKTKAYPMQFINNLLSKWHESKVETVEEAKKLTHLNSKSKVEKQLKQTRTYSKKDFDSLFTSLEEVEI